MLAMKTDAEQGTSRSQNPEWCVREARQVKILQAGNPPRVGPSVELDGSTMTTLAVTLDEP